MFRMDAKELYPHPEDVRVIQHQAKVDDEDESDAEAPYSKVVVGREVDGADRRHRELDPQEHLLAYRKCPAHRRNELVTTVMDMNECEHSIDGTQGYDGDGPGKCFRIELINVLLVAFVSTPKARSSMRGPYAKSGGRRCASVG